MRALHVSAWMQLRLSEFAAEPGGGKSENNERNGIPVWPEGWTRVPRGHSAENTYSETQDAEHDGVHHGPIGREPRGKVAAHDAVNGAIDGCQQECTIVANHGSAPRRKDVGHV